MCRFLMVKSEHPIRPLPFLERFAEMCRRSKSFDGDWQGDGWGIGMAMNGVQSGWSIHKSVQPIWEDRHVFDGFPESSRFVVQARSASFPHHKAEIRYNQPFVDDLHTFVFNGMVKKVSLPFQVEGEIGSQKIWAILRRLLSDLPPRGALLELKKLLDQHSQTIQALNIGLADRECLYAYCYFTRHPDYYRLYSYESASLKMIVSEPMEGYSFCPLPLDEVVTF